MAVRSAPAGRRSGCAALRDRAGGGPLGDLVAVVGAERPGRLLREGIAVALAVGRAHERRNDLEAPLADLGRLAPEIGEPEVDVQLE
jgi:hypothetical protein